MAIAAPIAATAAAEAAAMTAAATVAAETAAAGAFAGGAGTAAALGASSAAMAPSVGMGMANALAAMPGGMAGMSVDPMAAGPNALGAHVMTPDAASIGLAQPQFNPATPWEQMTGGLGKLGGAMRTPVGAQMSAQLTGGLLNPQQQQAPAPIGPRQGPQPPPMPQPAQSFRPGPVRSAGGAGNQQLSPELIRLLLSMRG